MPSVEIREADTPEQLRACFPVMAELRTTLTEEEFLERVGRQRAHGYRVAYSIDADRVVCVAGFRTVESLAWGRALYVDDLVTRATARSAGHGARMLTWLEDRARTLGCTQLHLDSGVQRADAHRFYEANGMTRAGYHFFRELGAG